MDNHVPGGVDPHDTFSKERYNTFRRITDAYINREIIPTLIYAGYHVTHPTTIQEDYDGIDLYINGIPTQVKIRFDRPDPYLQGACGSFKDDLDTKARLWLFSSPAGLFLWKVSELHDVTITNTWTNDHGRVLRFFSPWEPTNYLYFHSSLLSPN